MTSYLVLCLVLPSAAVALPTVYYFFSRWRYRRWVKNYCNSRDKSNASLLRKP